MLSTTHSRIAKLIYKQFTEELQENISKTALIEGSKLPDLSLQHRSKKHNLEESYSFIKDNIADILSRKQSRRELGLKLGIIIHYISDFCCAYHSNPRYNKRNITLHISYEYRIARFAESIEDFKTQLIRYSNINNLDLEIDDYITRFHNNTKSNPEDDLNHALNLSKSVIDLIYAQYSNQFVYEYSDSQNKPKIAIFSDTYFPHINCVSNTLFQYIKFLENNKINSS